HVDEVASRDRRNSQPADNTAIAANAICAVRAQLRRDLRWHGDWCVRTHMDTVGRVDDSLQAIFADGLGGRRRREGPHKPLEIVYLHEQLTVLPSLEFLVRERISRFANIHNDSWTYVRGIERVGGAASRLALVSEAVTGVRLSQMLSVADQSLLPLDLDAALYLTRQILAATAQLHEA